MTIQSSFGAVHLDVNPGAESSAAVLEPETPFRILLLGDPPSAADDEEAAR